MGSEKVLPLGLHLVASDPVNGYCLNHDNNSSDVAVMYPVQSLGTEYFTMCYKTRSTVQIYVFFRLCNAILYFHLQERVTNYFFRSLPSLAMQTAIR